MAVRIYREPIERDRQAGVTIREIEERVRELNPSWTQAVVEAASLLFAILKEGCSTQKLLAFTRYPSEFLMNHVDHMRSRGELFTGTLSTRYVLKEVPGSEDLIEKITGQKIVTETVAHKAPAGYQWERSLIKPSLARLAPSVADPNGKEEPMNTEINGAEAVGAGAETCGKSKDCGKPANHLGRCKGGGGRDAKSRASTEGARRKPNSRAGAPKSKASKPAKSYTDARAFMTATAAAINPGRFKIEYEDEELSINVEGVGREAFASAVKVALGSLGGSNG